MTFKEAKPGTEVIVHKLKNKELTKPFRGEIVSAVEGSKTLFIVKDIERGAGWSEEKQRYIGVKVKNGWYRGQNYDYGTEVIIHRDNMEKTK